MYENNTALQKSTGPPDCTVRVIEDKYNTKQHNVVEMHDSDVRNQALIPVLLLTRKSSDFPKAKFPLM